MGCCSGCGLQRPYIKGKDGANGLDNYALAVQSGEFTGTLAQYLASLHGPAGASAYDLAVAAGFSGTEADWLASLQGANGTNGTNGINAYSFTSASFVQPAIGGTVVVQVDYNQWMTSGQPVQVGNDPSLLNNNWYICAGILFGSAILVNPGPLQGYPSGISTNAVAGTTIASGTKVAPRGLDGRDGINGGDGGIGPVGPTGPGVFVSSSIPPAVTDPDDAVTAIVTNAPSTPGIPMLYSWNGSAWVASLSLKGADGTQMAFLTADPNTMPSTYMAVGDVVWDDSVAGSMKVWQKQPDNSWLLKGTIQGASAPSGNLFRVGQTTPQPILVGGTSAAVVQFERTSPSPLFNGGAWDGAKFTAPSTISGAITFRLENFKVTSATAGDTLTFSVKIRQNGGDKATGTITIGPSDTEGTLPLLEYTFGSGLATGDKVDVTITPSSGPTKQWYMGDTDTAFYNRT